MSKYGVPFVKGPEVKLPPHPQSCSLECVKEFAQNSSRPLSIDLFSGAGGLSLGLRLAGFQVILAAEIEREAAETHRAQFPGATICVDLSDPDVIDNICSALDGVELDLVAGGPPCQPYSQAAFSKVRHLEAFHGRQADSRRSLWASYIEIVRRTRPKAVLVENVPDMAFGRDGVVLRNLVEDLENLGYAVHSRVLASDSFGVPQHRQRLITVAFKDPRPFAWPDREDYDQRVLRDAIEDLPAVEGGNKEESRPYHSTPTVLQKYFRDSVPPDQASVIYDHHTRAVRSDDLEAFKLMTSKTKYGDLPDHLKRYRDDIFQDKYKRLDFDTLSRTITAHISQDGYWYIHPTQHRTLTIREAARIQTFPDYFRFCGFPRHAFKQIGEAVPPLLGKAVGRSVLQALSCDVTPSRYRTTQHTVRVLTDWYSRIDTSNVKYPWLISKDIWAKIVGQLLFDRSGQSFIQREYSATLERWATPDQLLHDKDSEAFAETRFKFESYESLKALAMSILGGRTLSQELLNDCKVPATVGIRLLAVTGAGTRRPLNGALERLVRRYSGVVKRPEDGRGNAEMLLGRMVGSDSNGTVFRALNEVTAQFCSVRSATCHACPLREDCCYHASQLKELSLLDESLVDTLATSGYSESR